MTACPICNSIEGFTCTNSGGWAFGNIRHSCQVCGTFGTTIEAREDYLVADNSRASKAVRAAISHWVRNRQAKRNLDDIPLVTEDVFNAAVTREITLPNPKQQATNIIRYIGEGTLGDLEVLPGLGPEFHAAVGSISRRFSHRLLFELVSAGLIHAEDGSTLSMYDAYDVGLTLKGWDAFEAERRGQLDSGYGFIALKFGDPVLDPFLKDHIRPAIQSMGFELRDMRDSARAGIIDNLIRMEIRNAAFVLVDLTHDNSGAYWEAGYAEGLGKPVLYICEQAKFDEAKTHFDTNHCTTVLWSRERADSFKDSLLATLQRSLINEDSAMKT